VDIFFDTTVLVAASEQSHPYYAQARPALLRVAAGRSSRVSIRLKRRIVTDNILALAKQHNTR